MQISKIFTSLMLTSLSLALPADDIIKPSCISKCPDGYPYNSCVVYVRDPCADHQLPPCKGPDDFRCKCKCKNSDITFLCNVQYFRDPCSPLPVTSIIKY